MIRSSISGSGTAAAWLPAARRMLAAGFASVLAAIVLATPPAAVAAAKVTLSWVKPAEGTTVSGLASLKLKGKAFQNVEIFDAATGAMVVRATVSSDSKRATASLDTTRFPDGALTLTAHAWNSPAGTPYTSDADAGPLHLVVKNGATVALGVYAGNDVAAVQQFEAWLGRDVDGLLGFTGDASWADYDGSVPWAIGLWSGLDRPVYWSIPLIPAGAGITLDAAATGAYDAHYRLAAQALVGSRPQDATLRIRTGWEFNGNWFPWTAQGKASQYVGAFRHFVSAFRQVAVEAGRPGRFAFEWNVNLGASGMSNPGDAYPGDDVVDVIGMDFYWDTQYGITDPLEAWDWAVNQPYGLAWHQAFAAQHGKPTAYSEWGIRSDAAGPYIQQAHAWFASHPVLFQTYWNSNSAFPGELSHDQYPTAGAVYRDEFGPN